MASGLTLSTFDAGLKQHYTSDRVQDMVYKRNPLLALMPKMEDFGGRNLPIPLIYGNPQGRSKTFSTAQTLSTSSSTKIDDFVLLRTKDYAVATVDGETMEASKGDVNAFITAATTEIDGAINSLTRSIAIGMYRTSDASIGQVLAEPTETTVTTFTLKQTSDVTNFEVGQTLNIWSAITAGSQRNRNGTATDLVVAAVDRDAGTVTCTGAYDSSGTIAANDYIFAKGDRGVGISGLADWIPDSAPAATLFFGMDRSVDATRLGGLRYDASGVPIEEAIIESDAKVEREGWYIDHLFMNPRKVGDLKKALGTKVQYVDLQATARVSFTAVMVDGAGGPIKVVADQNCPYNRGYGLNMEMWKLYTLGAAVRPVNHDDAGLALRQASDDGVEIRYGFYGNVGCRAPGSNIVIKFS